MTTCTCGHQRISHDRDRYCQAATGGARGGRVCTCSRYAPARAERLERVTTDELHPGELVLTHGMRVRLGECRVWSMAGTAAAEHGNATTEPIYTFREGVIENYDELPSDIRHYVGTRETWTVQGNHLAHWSRVVES